MSVAAYISGGQVELAMKNLLSLADSSGRVSIVGEYENFQTTSSDPLVQFVDRMLYNNGQPLTAGSAPRYGTYWDRAMSAR